MTSLNKNSTEVQSFLRGLSIQEQVDKLGDVFETDIPLFQQLCPIFVDQNKGQKLKGEIKIRKDAGIIPVFDRVLKEEERQPHQVSMAFQLIEIVFNACPSAPEWSTAMGIMQALVDALNDYGDNEEVLHAGMSLFRNLNENEETRKSMRMHALVESLINLISIYDDMMDYSGTMEQNEGMGAEGAEEQEDVVQKSARDENAVDSRNAHITSIKDTIRDYIIKLTTHVLSGAPLVPSLHIPQFKKEITIKGKRQPSVYEQVVGFRKANGMEMPKPPDGEVQQKLEVKTPAKSASQRRKSPAPNKKDDGKPRRLSMRDQQEAARKQREAQIAALKGGSKTPRSGRASPRPRSPRLTPRGTPKTEEPNPGDQSPSSSPSPKPDPATPTPDAPTPEPSNPDDPKTEPPKLSIEEPEEEKPEAETPKPSTRSSLPLEEANSAQIMVLRGEGLVPMDRNKLKAATSDPYVIILDGQQKKAGKSKVKSKTLDPVWNFECVAKLSHGHTVTIQIFDQDFGKKDDPMGKVDVDVVQLAEDGDRQWFKLETFQGVQLDGLGEIEVMARLVNVKFAQETPRPTEEEQKKAEEKKANPAAELPTDVKELQILMEMREKARKEKEKQERIMLAKLPKNVREEFLMKKKAIMWARAVSDKLKPGEPFPEPVIGDYFKNAREVRVAKAAILESRSAAIGQVAKEATKGQKRTSVKDRGHAGSKTTWGNLNQVSQAEKNVNVQRQKDESVKVQGEMAVRANIQRQHQREAKKHARNNSVQMPMGWEKQKGGGGGTGQTSTLGTHMVGGASQNHSWERQASPNKRRARRASPSPGR